MYKIIVEKSTGEQVVKVLSKSGKYHDPSMVIFDERKHGMLGAMPELGGLYRENGELLVNAEAKAAHDAVITAREAAKLAEDQASVDRIALMRRIDDATTVAQLRRIMKAMVRHILKLEQEQ